MASIPSNRLGTIQRSSRLVNRMTGAPYYWLSIETEWGLVDAFASPERIVGDVSEGHIAQVLVSLSGRILPPDQGT